MQEIAPHNLKIMEAIKIQTPTKEILKNMMNDEWINVDAIIDGSVNLELILMYQHGIVILDQPELDYDKNKCLNATIDGQIDAQIEAIENCLINGEYRDQFFEGVAIMHKTQLSILMNLKNIVTTQYN